MLCSFGGSVKFRCYARVDLVFKTCMQLALACVQKETESSVCAGAKLSLFDRSLKYTKGQAVWMSSSLQYWRHFRHIGLPGRTGSGDQLGSSAIK